MGLWCQMAAEQETECRIDLVAAATPLAVTALEQETECRIDLVAAATPLAVTAFGYQVHA